MNKSSVLEKMNNYINKANLLGKKYFEFQYEEKGNYVWISKIYEPISDATGKRVIKIPNFVSVLDNCTYEDNEELTDCILYIPKGCIIGDGKTKEEGIDVWLAELLCKIEVEEGHELYSSQDGVLFNKDKTEMLIYPGYKTEEEYTIPDSVKKVNHGFPSLYLKKIIISKNVIEMNDYIADGTIKVEVDAANTIYKSINGSLYSKDGQILYYLHHDGSKCLCIEEGTVLINKIFVKNMIEELYLPESLEATYELKDMFECYNINCISVIAPLKLEAFLAECGIYNVTYYE